MEISLLRNRQSLANFFSQDISAYFYCLGDLDDFYWPNTTCYGIDTPSGINAAVVLYRGEGLPVLLAFDQSNNMDQDYFRALMPLIPQQFYAHLSPGLDRFFIPTYTSIDHGKHYKMHLHDPIKLNVSGVDQTCQLSSHDLPEMMDLYNLSYPENAFDPRMILSGMYYGYREKGKLVSVGGIHVYSPQYKVAALGNITTDPVYRKQGFGKLVTARICLELCKSVDFIGLNVKADNEAAIQLYQSLGFLISSKYGEFSFKKGLKTPISL
jgi:GNAT superfamily N-acetyltransferase